MGGLRHLLRHAFDELWIIDLGGEGRGALTEENVFDIQTPVAIAVGIRSATETAENCVVRYLRINGDRANKFTQLRRLKLNDSADRVDGEGLERFVPVSAHDYRDWPRITDLFPVTYSGCQLKRTWPVAETKNLLNRRWRNLVNAVPRMRADLLKVTRDRDDASRVLPLQGGSSQLRPLRNLDRDEQPEKIARYGFRSFDRQWIIADQRVIDYPRPGLWRIRSDQQVTLTTITLTMPLGNGPVLHATPYVPDMAAFRGSFGDRSFMPLYLGIGEDAPNVANQALDEIGAAVGTKLTAEDLLAYTYALCGTSAFSERFGVQLAEAAGPVHIPMTRDLALFEEAVALGRDILWWHTWGERFAPKPSAKLPEGQAVEVAAVSGMPQDFGYDPESEELLVGSGVFAPVSPEVWEFEVSGLRVLQSWLGYRMKNRKGRKSSELDHIRPSRWTQSKELLLLLSILEHTIEVTPRAADLLERIVEGPLIPASDLPAPSPAERKPPKS